MFFCQASMVSVGFYTSGGWPQEKSSTKLHIKTVEDALLGPNHILTIVGKKACQIICA